MPQAIDIVINNGASTPVSKTFTLIAPAAGDGSYANWRLKEGTISSVFPAIAVKATQNARGTGRKVNVKFRLPSSYTEQVTGLTKVGSAFDFNVDVTVPDDFPESLKNDAVAFATNLMNTALIKACVRDAVPAT